MTVTDGWTIIAVHGSDGQEVTPVGGLYAVPDGTFTITVDGTVPTGVLTVTAVGGNSVDRALG
jgi:hypothetical protein